MRNHGEKFAKAIGVLDVEDEVEKFIQVNTVQVKENVFKCPLR